MSFLLSVVIQVINENHIRTLEGERNPPIAAYPDGPVIFKAAMKRMQVVARGVQIVWHDGGIQGRQKVAQPCGVLRPYPRLRARLSELLQSFVTVALDHSYSVCT